MPKALPLGYYIYGFQPYQKQARGLIPLPIDYVNSIQIFSVKCCHWTNRLTVFTVVVVPVCVVAVEVQVVCVVGIVLRTTPIVAVAACVIERTIVVVAIAHCRQKKQKRF